VKRARSLAVPAALALLALPVLLALRPLSTSRALAIWLLLVAGITLVVLVRHFRRAHGARTAHRFEAALRGRAAAPSPPVELLRMERELALGVASAGHAQRRLLPLLRAAAAARAGSRHGIELERSPDAARVLLGEDTWELLRPDRPEPEDRHGPGVPRARIAEVIERLESL
jgi:hypothetical protein